METTTKSLEYAYPTSSKANQFGYGNEGCQYVVIRGAESESIVGERAFASKAEAVKNFKAIDAKTYKWSHVS